MTAHSTGAPRIAGMDIAQLGRRHLQPSTVPADFLNSAVGSPAAVTERIVSTNGVDLQVAEAGDPDGPLVVLCHGFPETAYSWRDQLPVLGAAGYRAVAPDQRGYGRSSRPEVVTDYDIVHLTGDLLGLLDDAGRERAVVIGHDWGAVVAWSLALLAPDRVAGVVAMSVPFIPRDATMPPIESMSTLFPWFYMVYFQDPGVADADLGRDPARTLRRMLCGLRSTGEDWPEMFAPDDRGFVDRIPEPDGLPDWLTQADLDRYVTDFTRTGFTGALNWYRNLDRNWRLMAATQGATVTVPARLIAGSEDLVVLLAPPSIQDGCLDDDRGTVIVEAAGHWVQQERPGEVNAALLEFLHDVGSW